MQSSLKDIYRITASRTGKDEEIYKTIGGFIFEETSKSLKKPKTLIIKLKGIGYWFLRKRKIKEFLAPYPPYYNIENYCDFETRSALLHFNTKKVLYDLLKARLKDYDSYVNKKAEFKIKKNEFKEIRKGKEGSHKTSEDKP